MSTTASVPYRPLGLIAECLESLGFQITHSYDDLIFVEHNAFLLQMGDKGQDVSLFFNVESNPESREEIAAMLKQRGKVHNLEITPQGRYELTSNEEDASLQLKFLTGVN